MHSKNTTETHQSEEEIRLEKLNALKEKNTPKGLKLLLRIDNIQKIQTAKELLERIVLPTTTSNS